MSHDNSTDEYYEDLILDIANDQHKHGYNTNDSNRYFIFRIARDLYAVPLLSVKEVVEELPLKQIPNTVPCFAGVMNVRGNVIGVIDLQKRFYDIFTTTTNGILIFEIGHAILGARVTQILAVVELHPDCVADRPNIVSRLPQEHIAGIATLAEHMITVLNLNNVLEKEELRLFPQVAHENAAS